MILIALRAPGIELTPHTTKKIFSQKINNRRSARIIAVQCIYAIEHDTAYSKNVDEKLAEIISIYTNELSDSKLSSVNQSYLIKLVRFAAINKSGIEAEVTKHLSKEWKISRIPKLIYCILICAVGELLLMETLNKKIIINDYLEIAKLFNHVGEAGFINSILDKIEITSCDLQSINQQCI